VWCGTLWYLNLYPIACCDRASTYMHNWTSNCHRLQNMKESTKKCQGPSPACNECSDTDIPVVILGFRDCGRSWAAEGALLAHSLPRSDHRWEPKKDRKKLETWKLISNHEVNIIHKYLSHSTYWKLFYLHWDVLRPNYISYLQFNQEGLEKTARFDLDFAIREERFPIHSKPTFRSYLHLQSLDLIYI
jgi:hypothetical protein